MTFADVLRSIREQSLTEKEKGTKFEQLMKRWLQTDPRYAALTNVWLWEEFPAKQDLYHHYIEEGKNDGKEI